jgi:hypothetical protein
MGPLRGQRMFHKSEKFYLYEQIDKPMKKEVLKTPQTPKPQHCQIETSNVLGPLQVRRKLREGGAKNFRALPVSFLLI